MEENYIRSNSLSGINLLHNATNNFVYDNYFNNIQNFYSWSVSPGGTNSWNTPLESETNIIGGPYIGGNYWAKPDGTGFSQTCEDADSNGICDVSYVIDGDNIDYFPLTEIFLDTTPPEAIISYNPETEEFVVEGIDDVDEEVNVSYEEVCDSRRRSWNVNRCIRTYTLKDSSENELILELEYRKYGNYLYIERLDFNYSNGEEVEIQDNSFYVNTRTLHQYLRLEEDTIFTIPNFRRNETIVIIREGSNVDVHKEEGLIGISILTDKGKLKYSLI